MSRQGPPPNAPADSETREPPTSEAGIRQRIVQLRRRANAAWYGQIVAGYLEDDADEMASTIAYSMLFSLMPILMLTALTVSLVTQLSDLHTTVTGWFVEDVPDEIAGPVEALVDFAAGNAATLGIATLFTLLYGGSKLYNALDRAFARIMHTPRRDYLRRKVYAICVSPLIATLWVLATLCSTVVTTLLTSVADDVFSRRPNLQTVLAANLASLVLCFGSILLAYWLIPQGGPSLRQAVPGAFTAAVLFGLLAQVFPIYLELSSGYSLYGSVMGFVLIFVFWLYLVGQIVVIGAEVTAYRAGVRPSNTPPPVGEQRRIPA